MPAYSIINDLLLVAQIAEIRPNDWAESLISDVPTLGCSKGARTE